METKKYISIVPIMLLCFSSVVTAQTNMLEDELTGDLPLITESSFGSTNDIQKLNTSNNEGWWSKRYLVDYSLIIGGTAGYIIGKGLDPREQSIIGPSFDRENPADVFLDDRFSETYLEQDVEETVPEYWIHRLLIGFGGALLTAEAVEWSRGNGSDLQFHDTLVGYAESIAITASLTELTKPFFARLRPDFTDRALRFHCPQSTLPAASEFCDEFDGDPLHDDPDEAEKLYNDGRKSFISGHSSHSFNLFGYSSLVVGGRYVWGEHATSRSRALGIAAQAVMVGSAVSISSSRLWDGRHHTGDVLAGALSGIAISNLSYWTRFNRDGMPRRSVGNQRSELTLSPWIHPVSSGAGLQARLDF